jgi:hypothetical protein
MSPHHPDNAALLYERPKALKLAKQLLTYTKDQSSESRDVEHAAPNWATVWQHGISEIRGVAKARLLKSREQL